MAQREEHWAIVDLKRKAGLTPTIPMPGWVKCLLDDWLQAAELTSGELFRGVNKTGRAWGEGITEKAGWHAVREYAAKAGIGKVGTARPSQDFRSNRIAGHRVQNTESSALDNFAVADQGN